MLICILNSYINFCIIKISIGKIELFSCWRKLVSFDFLDHSWFRVCKAVHVSSSTEHDSSKFTNQNGQGDYFVAGSGGSNKREAKVRDQKRVRGSVGRETGRRHPTGCAYVLSALCVHRNCGKTSTLGNAERDDDSVLARISYSAVLWIFYSRPSRESLRKLRVFQPSKLRTLIN